MSRVAVAFLTLLAPWVAQAELKVTASLDWLVVSSPHIALVTTDGSGAVRTTILRGNPPGGPPLDARLPRRLLSFMDAKGALVHTIDLEVDFDVSAPAYTAEFGVLTTEKDILARVRARLTRAAREVVHGSFTVQIPEGTPAFTSLSASGSGYLVVPADPSLRDGLLAALRADDVHVRACAAWRLSRYPGDETVRLLQAALTDPGTAVVRDGEPPVPVTTWPVRQNAYDALVALGVAVPKPAGWRAPDARHVVD